MRTIEMDGAAYPSIKAFCEDLKRRVNDIRRKRDRRTDQHWCRGMGTASNPSSIR